MNSIFSKLSNPIVRFGLYFLIANMALWSLSPAEHKIIYMLCGNVLSFIFIFSLENLVDKIHSVRFSLTAVLLTLAVAAFSLSPVTVKAGWPINHEVYYWKYRMIAYYLHFLQFDFFPIWSQGDCYGLGAPLPLFYHKLYYFLSSMIYLFVGNVKTSTILTLFIFEMAAVVGMFRCLRLLQIVKEVALPLSLLLLLMNYTATDWLIRGNMAEFSALCLIPWLILWCLKFIQNQRFSYSIIPILTLLFFAHNIIAFYGSFLVFISAIIILFSSDTKSQFLKQITIRGLISLLLFLLINSIYFIPMLLISDDYSVDKIKIGMEVENRFETFTKYFMDRSYVWLNTWHHVSVEINLIFSSFLAFLFLGHVVNAYKRFKKLKEGLNYAISAVKKPIILFLTISTLFLFYLQHPSSIWFYKLIPGADFIQFPWRLLTYIQVLLILILGVLLSRFNRDLVHPKFLAYLLLVCMIFNYPFYKHLNEEKWNWFSTEDIERIENKGTWGTAGEYNPMVENVDNNDHGYYKEKALQGIVSSGDCEILEQANSNTENITHFYKVTAAEESLLILPLNYSGLEEVEISKAGNTISIMPYRTDDDPRIRVDLPNGTYVLRIDMPTIGNAFRKLF